MTLTAGRAPYVRDVELSRLARAACFAAVGLYFASVVPSLPEGLEPDGHAGPVILVVMLGCLAIGMAIVSMMYLVRAERQRAVAHARSLLFDDVTGLHNRQYFIEMLNMEIRHAAREQRRFFVVLLQLQRQDGHGDPAARAHEIAAVATTIRSELQLGDRLAVLRNDEIAAIPLTNTLDGKLSEEQILSKFRLNLMRRQRKHKWRLRMCGMAFDGQGSDPARVIDAVRSKIRGTRWVTM
jgi:GGDEF domain-containing protein